ncbi:matrixin, partial [Sphingomonas oleivorans]
SITGNSGANRIDGGGGLDTLTGGGGADTLIGGADNDVFDYNALADSRGTAIDYIVDFTPGADRIDLSTIDADSGTGGNQAFSFIGTGVFSSAAGELRIDTGLGDRARVLADVDGDAIADMEIQVEGSLALAQADFVL